jgi:hypothetical protein
LRQRAQDGDFCGLEDDTTLSQLAGIRYKHNSRGQILIESKEDARKRGVKSPDRAESTMLAFAEPGGNWTGLLRFYQASAAKQAKEQPHAQQPVPKADGVHPAPPPPAPAKPGPVKAYERAIAAMVPQRLCAKCTLPIKEQDSVSTDGFQEWHEACNKPSWAS